MPDTAVIYEDDTGEKTCLRFMEGILGLINLEDLLEAPIVTVDKLIKDGWIVD